MSEFIKFRKAIQKQFDKMAKEGTLFMSSVSKDDIWNTYLSSFPEGTNPVFRERTDHDCQCCKQFIRYVGRVLGQVDGKLVSVWDIEIDNFYQEVADQLKQLNMSSGISGVFLHNEREIGRLQTIEHSTHGEIKWDHFYQVVPDSVYRKHEMGKEKGEAMTNRKVLERSLTEITGYALDTVEELILSNNLYRGEEHKGTVTTIKRLKSVLEQVEDKDLYLWNKAVELKGVSAFRNTVIGTLLVDLSQGEDLEVAVKKFEDKVAPHNYKRSKALITPRMKEEAKKKAKELGIEPSLIRRHAAKEDISVNNVLFADKSVTPFMEDSVFDTIKADTKKGKQDFSKVKEVSIDKFVKDVLPSADKVELYLENHMEKNLVTLLAPENPCAPNIFKWGNNFSWSYNGDVTDSLLKERVKTAGGDVGGVLRFSIQWDDTAVNRNDLDAHCLTPSGRLIYFGDKYCPRTRGNLDVDIMHPSNGVAAVENITFPDIGYMEEGVYKFYIHNFSERRGRNWEAQVEFDGEVFDYSYQGGFRSGQKQTVAEVKYTHSKGFEIVGGMKNSSVSKEIWALQTKNFHKVDMIMNSPNHWDGEGIGNKHLFFILGGCKNPDSVRTFYNEYLRQDLNDHRKVFEVLASNLKAEYNDEQLSGVGVSSTLNKEVVVKVTGVNTRLFKIKFGQ